MKIILNLIFFILPWKNVFPINRVLFIYRFSTRNPKNCRHATVQNVSTACFYICRTSRSTPPMFQSWAWHWQCPARSCFFTNGFPCGNSEHTKTETKLLKLFQFQCLCSTENSNSFMQISDCTEIEINWIMFSN